MGEESAGFGSVDGGGNEMSFLLQPFAHDCQLIGIVIDEHKVSHDRQRIAAPPSGFIASTGSRMVKIVPLPGML